MNKPIYMVNGTKGGVGKTMVSVGLIDTLLSEVGKDKPEKFLFIESDTANPDVWKMYKDELTIELIDLDGVDGWIDLVNLCEKNPDASIVINTAARNNKGVKAYGETLNGTLAELQRKLVTLWVINRQRDSLELLAEYMESLPTSTTHVIRNLYWGEENKFELYNGSKIKKTVESAGGKSLNFPDLADRVSDVLYCDRLSITAAIKKLPLGNRAELIRWRKEMHKSLEEILHD